MIKTTARADIEAHLRSLGVRIGMDIVVHSKLISFGLVDGGAGAVYDALRSVVGENATIAAPTYTFATSETEPYDPATTASTNVGMLGEYIRALPGAIRSASPIHNHAALGPRAAILAGTPPTASLGPDSDFVRFADAGFQCLLLGCEFSEGCTHAHHMEAIVGVPYREWIDLPRLSVRTIGAEPEPVTVRYYGRRDRGWQENFEVVRDELRRRSEVSEAPTHYGRSYLVSLAALEACVVSLLAADPYALVVKKAGG